VIGANDVRHCWLLLSAAGVVVVVPFPSRPVCLPVRYLAEEAGIRQFLDIGTGIPTAPNVHQVAQADSSQAREGG
jgi:hypothetical protein